jgi:hypothetical protein
MRRQIGKTSGGMQPWAASLFCWLPHKRPCKGIMRESLSRRDPNDVLTPRNRHLLGCLLATCIALAVLRPIHNSQHLFALEDLFL